MSSTSNNRRQILSGLMKLLFFIGFVFLSIPFISTFSTNDISEKQKSSTRWVISLPTSALVDGEVKFLSWSGGLVWVYVRNEKEIQSLKNKNNLLRDAASLKSDQPDSMKNNFRSDSEKYFVFIPQENKKSCQVSLNRESESMIFTEPCFNAKYDAAGRIFKNSGHREQQNLSVPKHVIEDGVLKVGIWTPKL
jgi:Rieske Fe-S protein